MKKLYVSDRVRTSGMRPPQIGCVTEGVVAVSRGKYTVEGDRTLFRIGLAPLP